MHHRSYIGKDFFAKGERTRAANTCLASSLPRAQRRFPSPSPSPKEERAGERRPFFISFPSLQLSPPEPRETSNVQHRTTNVEVNEDSRCHSMFGAGCSMSDVPPSSWGGNTSKTRAGIEAMNQIGTPLPALSPHGGERVAEGRERGWFMVPMHAEKRKGALHELPLSRPAATLSPPCGERAGRGVPIWFMVPCMRKTKGGSP